LRRLRHAVGKDVGGPGVVPHQVGELIADGNCVPKQLLVGGIAAIEVGEVKRFARRRIRRVLAERFDRALADRHDVLSAVGLFQRGDEVFGQAGDLRCGQRDRRLVVAEVFGELTLHCVQFVAERNKLLAVCRRQRRAGPFHQHEPHLGELTVGGRARCPAGRGGRDGVEEIGPGGDRILKRALVVLTGKRRVAHAAVGRDLREQRLDHGLVVEVRERVFERQNDRAERARAARGDERVDLFFRLRDRSSTVGLHLRRR